MNHKYPSLKIIKNDFINDTFLDNLEKDNTHPKDVHIGLDLPQMFTRFIEEGVSTSSFYDEIDYQYSLYQIIIQNYEIIKNKSDELEENERFEISIVNEKIHYGIKQFINGDLRKIETNKITAIINKNEDMPYGIQLVTIYPDISTNDAKTLSDDLSEDLLSSEGYQKSNALARLYYELTIMPDRPCSLMNIKTKEKWGSDNISCEIYTNNPNLKYQALITNSKIWWKEVIKNTRTDKWRARKLYQHEIISLMLTEQPFIYFIQKQFERLKELQRQIQIEQSQKKGY